jgi:hypothetical protein
MQKKIKCQTKTNTQTAKVRVRIIKAPIICSRELRQLACARAKAIVL